MFGRIVALVCFWAMASLGWMILGGVTQSRTDETAASLASGVSSLWGAPIVQSAPVANFWWRSSREDVETVEGPDGRPTTRTKTVWEDHSDDSPPTSTVVRANVRSDLRRKGLMWFSLYDVDFDGSWTFAHSHAEVGSRTFHLQLPQGVSMFDDLRVELDGNVVAPRLESGVVVIDLPVIEGITNTVSVHYKTRGADSWTYLPTNGVAQVDAFDLKITTDFADYDFPSQTLSPSLKESAGGGEVLSWTFQHLVSGNGMGVSTPTRIQPGRLVSELSFSAPISLGFFMLWIFVIALLKRIDLHPINHLFIAGAFFSFHLLFAYTADRIPVEEAFALASTVSVVLVVSYLRLAVGAGFALREAGLGQLVYLVGFSLAHFWEGSSGLTITVLAILTLFVLMQLTGRLRWSELMAPPRQAAV